jgi:two-component sensor histidine kinase
LRKFVSPATGAQPRRAQDEILRADAPQSPCVTSWRSCFDPFGLERIDLPHTASALEVGQDLCIGLALLLNELATNAVKYGALSQPTGRVRLTCCFTDGLARLDWLESGGPRVQPTRRASFGTLLLGAALASPGGQAPRGFAPSGVVCAMTFPANL